MGPADTIPISCRCGSQRKRAQHVPGLGYRRLVPSHREANSGCSARAHRVSSDFHPSACPVRRRTATVVRGGSSLDGGLPRMVGGGPGEVVLAIGILAVAVNLRPPLSSVPPLLSEIRTDLGVSSAVVAFLSAAPLLCFGVLAPVARPLAARIGEETTVLLALVALLAGIVVRVGPNAATLLLGTVLAGGAIAVANVMLPVVVRTRLPRHIGLVTGAYVTLLTVGSSAAAGATVPLAARLRLGWRGGLGFWCLPVVAAIVIWAPQARPRTALRPGAPHDGAPSLLANRLAWAIAVLFGTEALGFYAILTWLPTIYLSLGYSATLAGQLLSISLLAGAPAALVLPALAARSRTSDHT